VTFIYGAHDWMRPSHAIELCTALKAAGRLPRAPGDLKVEVIEDAGHFVFMEQASAFNSSLLAICAR
jgi:abhydrolase domain-containing protein 5